MVMFGHASVWCFTYKWLYKYVRVLTTWHRVHTHTHTTHHVCTLTSCVDFAGISTVMTTLPIGASLLDTSLDVCDFPAKFLTSLPLSTNSPMGIIICNQEVMVNALVIILHLTWAFGFCMKFNSHCYHYNDGYYDNADDEYCYTNSNTYSTASRVRCWWLYSWKKETTLIPKCW